MEGNFIGTDVAGTLPLENTGTGLLIAYSNGNTIGGTTAGAGNVIAASGGSGVGILGSSSVVVEGNWIGSNSAGATGLGNTLNGVALAESTNITIGGPTAAARNMISGNHATGVAIFGSGCAENLVEGNFIGVDATGENPIGNGGFGVFVGDSAFLGNDSSFTGAAYDNTITNNVISANAFGGVAIAGQGASGNLIQGCLIGMDSSGTSPRPNAGSGILVEESASDNTIGGTAGGVGNIIAFNGGKGVAVGLDLLDAALDNAVLENSIFSNYGLGIALDNSAPQAAPVLTSVINNGSQTTIAGAVTGAPNTAFRIEFFSNPAGTSQGKTYLGFLEVMTNGSGSTSFSFAPASFVAAGLNVTATATDANGNTSEFSAAATVQTNVTNDLSVKLGGFVYNRTTRQFSQTLTITNISGCAHQRANRAGAPRPEECHARQPERHDAGQPLHQRVDQRLPGHRPELDHHARLHRPDACHDQLHPRIPGRADARL